MGPRIGAVGDTRHQGQHDVRNQHRGPPGFPRRNLTKLVIAVVTPSLLLALSIPLIRGSRTRSRKLPVA